MNVKKIIAGTLALCLIGGTLAYNSVKISDNSVVASAEDDEEVYKKGTYENLKYYRYADYVEIIGGDPKATEFVIPVEIDGLPVTSIGFLAFDMHTHLISITIPDSVTSIGQSAFQFCSGLKSITIPDSVTSIGIHAFQGCSGLKSITIPDSVISIGEFTFHGCSSLESIIIPDGVTSIGYGAFSGCKSLTSITIPDSVTSIGGEAFSGTPWLENKRAENPLVIVNNILFDGKTCTGDIIIPDSVTSIGDEAFSGSESLTSITIPDSVTSIGYNAFKYCKNLTSITIPDGVTSIGGEAFSDTPWLENKRAENPLVIVNNILIDGKKCEGDVVIPDSVTSIGDIAFYYCSGLTSITIPNGVISIGGSAFHGCSGLTSITIPNGVTSIGYRAFIGCSSLESIKIKNPECEIYDDEYTISKTATIYGYNGSTAQAYAKKYKRKFKSLGDAPATTETTIKVSLLGDANCDGELNIADATSIIQHIGNKDKYGLSEQGLANADGCDGKEGITGSDAIAIQKLEAKLITALPDKA